MQMIVNSIRTRATGRFVENGCSLEVAVNGGSIVKGKATRNLGFSEIVLLPKMELNHLPI